MSYVFISLCFVPFGNRPRKPLYTQTLERSHRHSRSAYDLDAMTPKDHSTNGVVNANKIKSKSMQHLHVIITFTIYMRKKTRNYIHYI